MRIIIDAFIPDGMSHTFSLSHDDHIVMFAVENRRLRICGGERRLAYFVQRVIGDSTCPLNEVLGKTYRCCTQPSRYKRNSDVARELFRVVVGVIGSVVESARGVHSSFEAVSLLELPVRFREGSRRARRVTQMYKVAVCESDSKDKHLTKPQLVLVAKAMFNKTGGLFTKMKQTRQDYVKPKTGSDFVPQFMLQYNAHARRVMEKNLYAFVAFDGVWAGTHEYAQYANWSVEQRVGCWLPCQDIVFASRMLFFSRPHTRRAHRTIAQPGAQ